MAWLPYRRQPLESYHQQCHLPGCLQACQPLGRLQQCQPPGCLPPCPSLATYQSKLRPRKSPPCPMLAMPMKDLSLLRRQKRMDLTQISQPGQMSQSRKQVSRRSQPNHQSSGQQNRKWGSRGTWRRSISNLLLSCLSIRT